MLHSAGDFAEVVRRDVSRHAHRDSSGTVEQQVRYARGKNVGLLLGVVVVRNHVDRLLLDVGHQLAGDRREA